MQLIDAKYWMKTYSFVCACPTGEDEELKYISMFAGKERKRKKHLFIKCLSLDALYIYFSHHQCNALSWNRNKSRINIAGRHPHPPAHTQTGCTIRKVRMKAQKLPTLSIQCISWDHLIDFKFSLIFLFQKRKITWIFHKFPLFYFFLNFFIRVSFYIYIYIFFFISFLCNCFLCLSLFAFNQRQGTNVHKAQVAKVSTLILTYSSHVSK